MLPIPPISSPHEELELDEDLETPSTPSPPTPPRLEPTILTDGPFAGMPLPHGSSRANAAHIVRSHVATYLISHPHLDHIAGFVINTAAFHATSRPKTLAALPFTVDAIKKYIFNDVIWPNLSDEDGGVGFVTFQRLKEGGDIMVGEGEGRGYIEVCEGLGAKGFKISHGKCMRQGSFDAARNSVSNLSDGSLSYVGTPRYTEGRIMSMSHIHLPSTPYAYHPGHNSQSGTSHPFQHHQHQYTPNFQQSQTPRPLDENTNSSPVDSTAYFIRDTTTACEVLIFGDVEPDSVSIFPRLARVWSEAAPKIASGILTGIFIECSYDDSQTDAVLFGHMAPRHLVAELQILAEMVREERIMKATQRAMRKRKRAHLSTSSLGSNSAAIAVATSAISALRDEEEMFHVEKKQRSKSVVGRGVMAQFRRSSVPDDVVLSTSTSTSNAPFLLEAPPSSAPKDYLLAGGSMNVGKDPGITLAHPPHTASLPLEHDTVMAASASVISTTANHEPPLKGLRVMIMHVKDTMKDGPHVADLILEQVLEHTAALKSRGIRLGCEFEVCEPGGSYWF